LDQLDEGALSGELSAVLEGLKSEGELNSSGVFTVDLKKALPKLEKFQLPKPHFGLLKIVQSAVVAGATRLNCSFDPLNIRLEHNGTPPSPEELGNILSYLMEPDFPTHNRSLRDLAIGINTTLARGGRWVEVKVKDGEGWFRQRWLSRQDSELKEAEHSGKGDITVSFVMRRSMSDSASQAYHFASTDLIKMATGERGGLDQDGQVIYDRCRHAPMEIKIGRRTLPESSFGKRITRRWSPFSKRDHQKANLMDLVFTCEQASPHLLSPPAHSQARHCYIVPGRFQDGRFRKTGRPRLVDSPSEARSRCFAVFGIRDRATIPGTVTLIKDGVDLTTLAPPSVPKGVTSLVCAEGLKLDVSHFRIVKGPSVVELIQWLWESLSESLGEILEEREFTELGPDQRAHLRGLSGSQEGKPT